MVQIIKPPTKLKFNSNTPSVFLAGSIEMGRAENWQSKFEGKLQRYNVVILNPRRDNWDSNLVQSINNKKFREQVEWELSAQERADIIAMYFSPKTKSPITLLELGLFANSNKLIVCCPEGFWRKGNVDIVCKRYNIKTAKNLESLINLVKRQLNKLIHKS